MKILVTGGAGFIESNLIHYLLSARRDTKVVNLDKFTCAGNPENLTDLAKDRATRLCVAMWQTPIHWTPLFPGDSMG